MNAEPLPNTAPRADLVPIRRALRAGFAISLQTFGGPAGQIAVMHARWSTSGVTGWGRCT